MSLQPMIKLASACFLFISLVITQALFASTDLTRAIVEHDHQTVNSILANDPAAWRSEEYYIGDTPVGLAITEANLVALKLFVEAGYQLNPDDWYQHPARLISPYTGTDTPEHMQMLSWILSEINGHPNLDYHLIDFVKTKHYAGAKILLDNGVDPNTWVYDWNSVWDLTDDPKMKALLESYGGASNFHKLIMFSILAIVIILTLVKIILKPKQAIGNKGKAPSPERNLRKGKLFHFVGASF